MVTNQNFPTNEDDGRVSSPTAHEVLNFTSTGQPEKVPPEIDNDCDAESLSGIATADYPKGPKLAVIVLALVLSMTLVALDMTIVATAIPKITDDFHSLPDVGWYGSAFFLTIGSFQSTWGKAYKFFPLKMLFLMSIGIFELGSLICAVAPDSTALIAGRAIAGVGAAGIGSGVYTIIAFAVPPAQRAAFAGILGAIYGCASVIGPLLGGIFTSHATWRWCFYINLPIGGASAVTIFLFFHTPAASKPAEASWLEKFLQMDPLGTITLMAAIICYLLAFQRAGSTKSWSSSPVLGTLVGFGILLMFFGVVEWWVGDRALLQGRFLRRREILVNCIYIFFFAGCFFVLLYYLPIYFQSVHGVSASRSGIDSIPLVLGVSFCSIISGRFITAFGTYILLMLIGSTLATIGTGLIFTLNIGSSSSKWIGYQALAGMGLGFGIQVPIIANQAFVELSDISSITAVTLFFQTIGGAFIVSAAQTAFTNRLLDRVPETVPDVDPGLVVATGATLLRDTFSATDIAGILTAFMAGLKISFALGIALAGVTLPIALFAKWQNIKPKPKGAAV